MTQCEVCVRRKFASCDAPFGVHVIFTHKILVGFTGAKMHLQGLTSLQVHNSTLEAFTRAALILALACVIITSNVILIAAIVNYRGAYIGECG